MISNSKKVMNALTTITILAVVVFVSLLVIVKQRPPHKEELEQLFAPWVMAPSENALDSTHKYSLAYMQRDDTNARNWLQREQDTGRIIYVPNQAPLIRILERHGLRVKVQVMDGIFKDTVGWVAYDDRWVSWRYRTK